MITLKNQFVSVTFSDKGALTSMQCLTTDRELLKKQEAQASPFAIWTEFIRPYETDHTLEPLEPSAICKNVLTPASSVLEACERNGEDLQLCYGGNGIQVTLHARLSGCELSMKLTLKNSGETETTLLPVFPSIPALDFEESDGAKMLVMNQAGYVGPCWIHRGGFYGNTWKHSAQFGCLFDEETCLGFLVKDAKFGSKDISYQKPSFEIRHIPGVTLEPGESVTLPEVTLLIYAGDWQRTAAAYGAWFRKTTNPDPVPDWVMETSSYTGTWSVKREENPKKQVTFGDVMDTFEELPEVYHNSPIEVKEYAFYCELSAHPVETENSPCGSGNRLHTDGWNMVRKDLGGVEAMRRGVEDIHRIHRRLTLYIEGLITPPQSDLYVHIPEAQNWIFMEKDGTLAMAFGDRVWNNMCPGSDWQEHLAKMAARLVKETDCDGFRLDCLGVHFKPCWNPTHQHKSPYDYNSWLLSLFQKVAAAVRAVKPDVLLSTEYPVDYFSIHFNHALFQPFDDLVWHSLKAPSPLYTALPHYRIDSWYGGAVSQAMQLLPMSTSVNVPWYEVRHAVSSIFLHGKVMPDPKLSSENAYCRRTRTEEGDLLLFARPDMPENPSWELTEYHCAGELPLKSDRIQTRITMPLEYEPAEVLELDVQDGSIQEIPFAYDGAAICVRTKSNFSAIVFRRHKGNALIEWHTEMTKSGALEMRFTSPNLEKVTTAELSIEDLQGAEKLQTAIPGTIRVEIPENATKGIYRATLCGERIVPALKIIMI